jgi:hypothetical protein
MPGTTCRRRGRNPPPLGRPGGTLAVTAARRRIQKHQGCRPDACGETNAGACRNRLSWLCPGPRNLQARRQRDSPTVASSAGSSLLSARSREDGVALAMLVPEAEQELAAMITACRRSHDTLLDHACRGERPGRDRIALRPATRSTW